MKSVFLALLLPLSLASPSTSSREYLGLAAGVKLSRLWRLCQQDQKSAPGSWFSNLRNPGLLLEAMCPTFTVPGDELPLGRGKAIHSVGAVARVEWRSRGTHSYTGVFKVIASIFCTFSFSLNLFCSAYVEALTGIALLKSLQVCSQAS